MGRAAATREQPSTGLSLSLFPSHIVVLEGVRKRRKIRERDGEKRRERERRRRRCRPNDRVEGSGTRGATTGCRDAPLGLSGDPQTFIMIFLIPGKSLISHRTSGKTLGNKGETWEFKLTGKGRSTDLVSIYLCQPMR